MVRSVAAVAPIAQRGCSSSTDSLTHPGSSCSIVGFAVSPSYPSRAEDVLPPLPPSNTGAVVRLPSTSARAPSRSSKSEGLQEELAATTSEKPQQDPHQETNDAAVTSPRKINKAVLVVREN
ncbi:hypothetical protein ACQJBY_030406 [Aegilops geniculata]